MQTIYTGQGIAKDCIVGDVQMNRYAIFNGLELPRRIGSNLVVTPLGVDKAATPTSTTISATAGSLTDTKWYAWVAVYASNRYVRPVGALDGSGSMTRGNPSLPKSYQVSGASKAVDVVVPTTSQAGITYVLLYRAVASSSAAEAEAGPFFYVGQAVNTGATVTITDGTADADLTGLPAVEENNYPPNAYRYAVAISGYIFAGGNFVLGAANNCTVTLGSSTVTADADIFYDGIKGWKFKCTNDVSGGVDGTGLFYVNYVDAHTLQLVDGVGVAKNYDGTVAGSGRAFLTYLPGNVLRWSKKSEPEAWPLDNSIDFEGTITGLIQIPNQPLLLVCTDRPSMFLLDTNLIGTSSFKTNKYLISTTYSASSHYSLVPVEGKVRGIDASLGCIFEVEGTNVKDITKDVVPRIWSYLSPDLNVVRNWHCAYDQKQKLFGAFVTFQNAHRMIDFCIGQNVITGSWFFNWEKDLLCTGDYRDPVSGEFLVLGGTQGFTTDGAVWGRIWAPGVYDEWYPGGLRSGTIIASTGALSFTVDNTDENLHTANGGLKGRWVLITDANDEHEQLGYILSNTTNSITLSSVVQGTSQPLALNPLPVLGCKFYIGLIECRWGPKLFDFGDPDTPKVVTEVWCCVVDHDTLNMPFLRVYRGFDTEYAKQITLQEHRYHDKTRTQTLANVVSNKLESTQRWAVSWHDRSYGPVTLRSISLVYAVAPMALKPATRSSV